MHRNVDIRNLAVLALGSAFVAAGCNVAGTSTAFQRSPAPQNRDTRADRPDTTREGVDLFVAQPQEVDLVEHVVAARTRYHQGLRQLQTFYDEHGYPDKASWARSELVGLRGVQQFRYLLDAEVPSDALRPVDSIAEADALYEKGLEVMRRGGHGVPAIFRRDRMIEAAQTFRDLIEKYPTSDKIDDAAFFCGQIHKEYLPGQEAIAVRWYERVWTWNPQTPHPARFEAAVVCDYRLHDRDRALELYQSAVEHEAAFSSNARFATRRIRELTGANRPARSTGP